MKLQNFIIIFIIIILPIVLIFSLYLNLETKTITIQTDYDEKLIEATKEAVEAFEINTTEWNGKYSSLANLKRQDLMSSINVFTTSLSNKLGIGGSSRENILTYIPAIVYIMYDGYYIYSPTYVPETITNENGVQLFYYEDSGSEGAQITASATQNIGGTIVDGEPMYVYKEGEVKTGTYNGEPITFTTDISSAEKNYKHVLKTFVPYTSIQGNYIVNYTLDNYIRIYGEIQSKEGYVIEDFGGTNTIEVPVNSVSNIKANGNIIEAETLTENIYVRNNISEQAELKSYPYIYNSNNDKRYYDEDERKFFMLNDKNVKVFLPESYAGHTLAEYKKLLIRRTDTEYLELYQLLNSDSIDNKWYYKEGKNKYLPYEAEADVPINGIETIGRGKDCSAINYYVETYCFNKWLRGIEGIKLSEQDIQDLLNNKNQKIIENINNNLNLSISNYNASSRMDYKIFELTDEDWEQALSNISMITFFQGIKTGLKTYNNYAIVTSTENNEYLSEDSLYYIGENSDGYYHRYYCSQGTANTYQAYRNTDFKVQSYDEEGVKYYYKHNANSGGEVQECFDCIVNRNNYKRSTNNYYDKTFYTALARERYIQMSKINLIINLNKKITVTFDANGGTCPTPSKEVTLYSTYGTLPNPTKDGFEFAGWYTATIEISSSDTVNIPQNHTLYARWESRVFFDANGGSCDEASRIVVQGDKYGELPPPTREGYIFNGWFTSKEGGELVGALTTVPNIGNHTLYAHWTSVTYTVTFDANGGTVYPTTTTGTLGSPYGELPTPTRTGHTFAGWYTEASGGTKVESTTNVTTAQNHTLYAHWTINTYTISYDANGGSGAPDSQTKTYGVDLTLSSKAPTRSGYTFLGWGASSNATSASYQPGETYKTNGDATLYAVWQQVISVTGVSLDKTADQWIPLNDNGSAGTLSLTATVTPSNATNKTVTWTSSNTSVATVSNGSVTATGAGCTTITATAGGKSASVDVYVYNAVFNTGYTWSMRNSKGSSSITGYFDSGENERRNKNDSYRYW